MTLCSDSASGGAAATPRPERHRHIPRARVEKAIKAKNCEGVELKMTWLGLHCWLLIGCLLPRLQTQVTQKAMLPLHADIVHGGRLSPTKQLTISQSTWKLSNTRRTCHDFEFRETRLHHGYYRPQQLPLKCFIDFAAETSFPTALLISRSIKVSGGALSRRKRRHDNERII